MAKDHIGASPARKTCTEKCRSLLTAYLLKLQVKERYLTENKGRRGLEVRRSSNDKPSPFR